MSLLHQPGHIGSLLVKNVLDADGSVRVGVVRDPARVPADIREGVEIVKNAFKNVDVVLWLVPLDPKAEGVAAAHGDFLRPACSPFLSEGVKPVVGVSSLGRGTPQAKRAGNSTASLMMDDPIAGTGINYRALACPSCMEDLLRQVASIKNPGAFSSPTNGDLEIATCATRDIAATAARLLIGRSWSGTRGVPAPGPEDLSFNEMARIVSEVLGKSVRFEESSREGLRSRCLASGARRQWRRL